jgi:predicted nucleic acid-binding protein
MAEVIKDNKQPPLSAAEEAAIDGLLHQPYIEWVEVDLVVAKAARNIARQHGLKPADAIHLASAVRGGTDQFLTWDTAHFPEGAVLEGVTCTRPHLVGLPQSLEGFPSND